MSAPTKHLDRELGLFSVFSISMGAMMSSGIFVLPLIAAQKVGPGVAVAYLLAGVAVIPALLTKAELASAMPIAGGTYVYVDRSMGPWMGTVTGLGTWLSLVAKTAFALVGLGAYLHLFAEISTLPIAVVMLIGLMGLNILGATSASLVQRVIVLGCLVALAGFAAGGAPSVRTENLTPLFVDGVPGIFAGAGLVVVSYAGVTKVCSVAEEVSRPERNLPLGMIAAQLTAMVVYAVVATVITGNVDLASLGGSGSHGHAPAELLTPVATAAEVFWGRPGVVAMALTAAAGLLSMSNAGILASSRYPFAMARDGLMPRLLARVHPALGTPLISILLTGSVTLVALVALPVEELAHLASAFTLFVFCLVNLALVALRESGARWYRPAFRTPLYPWLPLLGVFSGGALLWFMGNVAVLACVSASVLGTIWYFAFARGDVGRSSVVSLLGGQRALRQTERFELEEAGGVPARGRVVTPVYDNQPAPTRQIHLAAAFVPEGGVLEVMRVEELPDQTALGTLLGSDADLEALEAAAREEADDLRVELDFHDVVTHNAKQALAHRAEATRADWIIAPWPERRNLAAWIRHPLAWWADDPPCDHAQFLDRGATSFRRILVLAQPGPYDTLLVHVAERLAKADDGEITLFLAASGPPDPHEAYHRELARLCSVPVRSVVRDVEAGDLVSTVTELSAGFDLLLLGAEAELGLVALTNDSRVDRMAAGAACSVLRVKAPRHRVHPYVDRRELGDRRVEASDVVVGVGLEVASVGELFAEIARRMAEDDEHPAVLEAALWERERRQSTALATGLQVTAANHPALGRVRAGVFTLARPVRFARPDRHRVDVCLVVLAPPGERNHQLWLVQELYPLLSRDGVLPAVRRAEEDEELRARLGLGASRRST